MSRAFSRSLPALSMLLLALGGCTGAPGTNPDTNPGTDPGLRPQADAEPGTAWQGDRSTTTGRTELTARTGEDWTRLWVQAGIPAPVSLPDDRMAVALFLGPRTGAGYAVSLDPATVQDGTVVVPYHESVPGPDDPGGAQPTSPFAVRLIAAGPQPVRFVLAP
jgi:hypothetical protein